MPDLASPGGELEPIETASADELRALQLERLRWSLRHAYDNVPHYRDAFDAAGVHPDDLQGPGRTWPSSRSPRKADLRDNYPFGMFAVPREQVVRVHATSGTTGRPTVVGYTADDIDIWATRHGPLDPGGRRAAGAHRARRVRLRAVHRRARRALRRRAARLHRGPGLRRHDRAAGHPDQRLPAGHHHGHAVVHAGHRRRDGAPGPRPGRLLAAVRHLRRRAVDQRDAGRDRGQGRPRRHRHLRPVRGDGPGRRAGVRGDQGRPAHLGGPLLPRGHRPAHRRGAARRRAKASSSSPR